MADLETLGLVNRVAAALACLGLPERRAVELVYDRRKKAERDDILRRAERASCVGCDPAADAEAA